MKVGVFRIDRVPAEIMWGITVIGANTVIGENAVIKAKEMIESDTEVTANEK